MRNPRPFVMYRGVCIWRNFLPGSALRWRAIGYGSADTLEGVKALIREADNGRA